jgi:hypothetical protein
MDDSGGGGGVITTESAAQAFMLYLATITTREL